MKKAQLRSVDHTDFLTKFRGVEERMGMQFGGSWFTRKLPKFGTKYLLSLDIDVLISEEDDTTLRDCKVRLRITFRSY
jgi:hypothetical protein